MITTPSVDAKIKTVTYEDLQNLDGVDLMPLYFPGPNSGLDWCLHVVDYRYKHQWIKYLHGWLLWCEIGRPKSALDAEHKIRLLEIELLDD